MQQWITCAIIMTGDVAVKKMSKQAKNYYSLQKQSEGKISTSVNIFDTIDSDQKTNCEQTRDLQKKVFRLILQHSILGIESKYVSFRPYITRDVIFLTTKSMSNNLWVYGSGQIDRMQICQIRTLSLLWLTYNKVDNGTCYQSHLLSLS